ncbi:hypothetical protein [Haliangium sp.]|uniref:hypothetical protein n=1 Tax=Haliangium sp. TaxID=2663208 RepID=UPI003D12EF32
MRAARNKPYRRSWKNLLINKRYQLGFTLFMVGVSTLLMSFLGYWVVREAQRATEVAINNVEGQRCPAVPALGSDDTEAVIIDEITEIQMPEARPAQAAEVAGDEAAEADEAAATDPADTAAGDSAATEAEVGADRAAEGEGEGEAGEAEAETEAQAGEGEAAEAELQAGEGEGEDVHRARSKIVLDEGTVLLDLPPAVPPGFVEAVIRHYRCRHEQIAKITSLHAGYRLILGLLVGACGLLIVGLTFWGIKMTHRIAGPLHKVGLYFAKMQDGRYDEVYNLRKGDQLVEFYEHFKAAHAGLQTMQRYDIEVLRGLIEAAEAAELGERSPELAEALDDMRATLARKEKSLE